MALEIRLEPICFGDQGALNQWLSACGLGEFMQGWTPRTVREGVWSRELCRWDYIIWNGRKVGAVWIEREDVSAVVAHLGILIAEESMRRRGIGTAVLGRVEEDAVSEWSVASMRLRVRKSNVAAIACYRKLGYVVIGKELRAAERKSYEVWEMEKAWG